MFFNNACIGIKRKIKPWKQLLLPVFQPHIPGMLISGNSSIGFGHNNVVLHILIHVIKRGAYTEKVGPVFSDHTCFCLGIIIPVAVMKSFYPLFYGIAHGI